MRLSAHGAEICVKRDTIHDMRRSQTAAERLYPETIGEYDLWLIKPGETTDYDGDVGLWRYSVSDSVDGVHTRIGRNRSLRDFPAIMRQRGLGGFAAPENPVRVEEPASLFSPSSPLMQAFETLSGLASFIDIMKLLFENDELAKSFVKPAGISTYPAEPVPDGAARTCRGAPPSHPSLLLCKKNTNRLPKSRMTI